MAKTMQVDSEARTDVEPFLLTGEQYRESLRDGRSVILAGEEISDVTTHPLYERSIGVLSGLFDAQFDPATRDLTTYVDPETGHRMSTGWLVPKNKEDLERRRRLLEFSTDRTLGVFGRPPDYGPTLAMGFLAAMHKIEKKEPEGPRKINAFIRTTGRPRWSDCGSSLDSPSMNGRARRRKPVRRLRELP